MRKEDRWKDARVAAEYDERRFGSALSRRKHARDVRLLGRILRRAGGGAGERWILDLPCGTCRLSAALATAGRVVGADVSLEMMRQAPPGTASPARLQASAFALPFRDGAFDAAVSMRFLFHLDDAEERVRVLREVGRVTAGPVLVQVRYRHTWKHAGRWLRSRVGLSRRYRPSSSRADVERELRAANLELIDLVPVSRLFSDKAVLIARAMS